MQKSLIFLLVFLTSFSAWATLPVSYKELIKYVQKNYADKNTEYPIHIVDRDEVEWLFAQKLAFGKENSQKRIDIIKEYIMSKTGVEIDDNDASNLDTFMHDIRNSAVALPLLESGGWGKKDYKMCVVMPASINTNQNLETYRLLSLEVEETYGDAKLHNIKNKLTLEQYLQMSLFHELSHCLDKKYMPATYNGEEDTHAVHMSESFAETMALLMLNEEGVQNLTQTRSKIRALYSRKVGHFMASNPQNGLGNPFYTSSGAIYFLSQSIDAVGTLLGEGQKAIGDLQILAEKIVEETAIESRSFTAIVAALGSVEEALKRYEKYANDWPDMFAKTLADLKDYLSYTDKIVLDAFDMDKEENEVIGELSKLEKEKFCKLFENNDQTGFMVLLETKRSELHQGLDSLENQKSRAQELYDIFANACN